jgi:flagellin
MRINRASDDAAGLSVSTSLNSKARIYSRSILNINDYTSALQIASGAMGQISNVVTRMIELSTQAANGTFSYSQRSSLNQEAESLRKEINRIMQTTTFQGRNLLDGTFSNSLAQVGESEASNNIMVDIGNVLNSIRGNGSFNTAVSSITANTNSGIAMGDLNRDGFDDIVTAHGTNGISIKYGNGDGTFGAASTYLTVGASSIQSIQIADLNNDGQLDIVSTRFNHSSAGPGLEILMNNGNGTFAAGNTFDFTYTGTREFILGDFNGDGSTDIIIGGQDTSQSYVSLRNNGDGTFAMVGSFALSDAFRSGQLKDLNGDGRADLIIGHINGDVSVSLGNGNGTFSSASTYALGTGAIRSLQLGDFNGDGRSDIAAAAQNGLSVLYGNSDQTFGNTTLVSSTGFDSMTIADFNDDGRSDIAVNSSTSLEVWTLTNSNSWGRTQNSTFASGQAGIAQADYNSDGVIDLVTANSGSGALFFQGQGTVGIGQVNLTNIYDARRSLTRLVNTLNNLSQSTGKLGATQSRLDIAKNNLTTLRENYLAADSRIKDTDMAQEAANYTRTKILQQIGASILAQANLSPQLALKLLT